MPVPDRPMNSFFPLYRDRHGRGDLGRGIAGDDQVDLVDVEQL